MEQPNAPNDPWTSLPLQSNVIQSADPRYQLIDSERYIDSLERRLKRIQGSNKPEPSSKDMINTLANFHQDQMRRFIDADMSRPTVSVFANLDSGTCASGWYIQRKLHPEKQAVLEEELFELLKDDHLERNRVELEQEEKEKADLNAKTVEKTESPESEKSSYTTQARSENSCRLSNSAQCDAASAETSRACTDQFLLSGESFRSDSETSEGAC